MDSALYHSEDPSEPELPGDFECVLCMGVVLRPLSCVTCHNLYCSNCIKKENFPCPKRCGNQEGKYSEPNRIVMNILNKLKFKCIKSPECAAISTYNNYEKHM
jgi:hypothetical protein